MKINRIALINIEWNYYNGYIFDLLNIDDRALFSLHFSKDFCIVNLFFLSMTVFDKTNTDPLVFKRYLHEIDSEITIEYWSILKGCMIYTENPIYKGIVGEGKDIIEALDDFLMLIEAKKEFVNSNTIRIEYD